MNKVIEIGRNVKNIELKQTGSGTMIAEFSIAVRRPFKSSGGENESDFFNCIAFNKLAETICKYVGKGDMIGVEGRLQTRNYTDREGRKVYVTEIIAENIEFLQSKRSGEQNSAGSDKTDMGDPFGGTTVANFENVNVDDDLPF
nr:MAG TPA: Single strand binding protein [Caudoviricetes sp.]